MGVRLPWQWPASPALPTLSRCCAAEIKSALLALLAGEAFLARRSWQEIWWGRLHLDLASGWQLAIEIKRDQLGALLWALAPDGSDWVYGCQRDDWSLGPDSQIVEPVGLLDPEQRLQLERLLRGALCWPPPLVSSDWVVPMASVELSGHSRRGLRRRRQSVANQMPHHGDVVPNLHQKP
jgi:hypothetical protein